jgi:hypothetical protein
MEKGSLNQPKETASSQMTNIPTDSDVEEIDPKNILLMEEAE